jgi:hypothetical protein
MPDAVIYKPCGNRRATVCSHCSKVHQRYAYQIVRSLLAAANKYPAVTRPSDRQCPLTISVHRTMSHAHRTAQEGMIW